MQQIDQQQKQFMKQMALRIQQNNVARQNQDLSQNVSTNRKHMVKPLDVISSGHTVTHYVWDKQNRKAIAQKLPAKLIEAKMKACVKHVHLTFIGHYLEFGKAQFYAAKADRAYNQKQCLAEYHRIMPRISGADVKQLRQRLGWSQSLMAAVLGIGQSTLSAIERGKHTPNKQQTNLLKMFVSPSIAYQMININLPRFEHDPRYAKQVAVLKRTMQWLKLKF